MLRLKLCFWLKTLAFFSYSSCRDTSTMLPLYNILSTRVSLSSFLSGCSPWLLSPSECSYSVFALDSSSLPADPSTTAVVLLFVLEVASSCWYWTAAAPA